MRLKVGARNVAAAATAGPEEIHETYNNGPFIERAQMAKASGREVDWQRKGSKPTRG